jgi:cobalamin biosynthesis protein CbiG
MESYSKHGVNVVSGRLSEDIVNTALLITEYLANNCNSEVNNSFDKYGCSKKKHLEALGIELLRVEGTEEHRSSNVCFFS